MMWIQQLRKHAEGSRLGDGTDNIRIHMLRQEEYLKGLI
jgi:hypothetical protein